MASYDDTATVSGSVVSIENGADEVGAKSCVVTVSPTLSGVSAVTEKQTDGNLLLPNDSDSSPVTTNGITRTYSLSGQSFSFNGTNEKTDSAWLVFNGSNFVLDGIKKGATYSFYHNLGVGMYAQVTYYNTQGTTRALVNVAGSAGKNNRTTFTVPSDFDRLRNFQIGVYAYATTINETDIVFMLTAGSTATAYTPYITPKTYTASLGRTIYGGEVDIVNGVGQSTHGMLTLTAEMINSATSYTYQGKVGIQIANCFPVNVIRTGNHICSVATVRKGASSDAEYMWFGSATGNKYLYWVGVLDAMSMTLEQWKTWALLQTIVCVYEEPTPTDFTFTGQEVPTRLGYNAFWSEQGNTELTYYKDGYGFTSVTIHKETPEGEPVEVIRKLHRIIYEGQVDVISGTGLIYRGESGTQYDPPEQISFPPIDISTDEGENTLYASEGDSVITYRKETD